MGDLRGFHDAGISAFPDVKSRKVGQGGTDSTRTSGVGSEPTVTELEIQATEDKFVMLCSDGVWEFIESQEAVQTVAQFPPEAAEQAAEHVAAMAWDRWMQ